MKIPIQEAPRATSRPIGTPYTQLDRSTGLQDVAQGAAQLGAGIQQYEAAARRAKKEADDFRRDEADLEMGKAINQHLYDKDTGFLNQLGENGLNNQPTLESIEKSRQSIAEGLANDEQRQGFSLRARARVEQARVSMERHSYEQRLHVYKGVADGQVQLALDTVAADPATVDSALGKVLVGPDGSPGPLRRYLMAQGLPTEAIQADEGKVRAQIYTTAVQTYVNAKDWRSAEALFTKVEGELGPGGKQLKAAIATLRQDIEGEAAAMKLVEAARNPENGRVDAARAEASLDSIPEGPLRDEARQRLEHRVGVEDKAWKQQVEGHYSQAFTAYLTGGLGAVNSQDKAWLLQNAPDDWDKIRMKAQADADRLRRMGREGRAHETDEERQALVELRSDMAGDPERYREMSVDEFTSLWGDRLSDSGYKEAGRVFANHKKEAKGTAAEFTRFITDEVRGNPDLKSKNVADQFRAFMGDRRREFLEQHKREPNLEEVETFRAAAFEQAVQKGWLWDTQVPAFRAKKPAPAPGSTAGPGTPAGGGGKSPAPATPPPPSTPAPKVEVTDGKQRGLVAADKVAGWLQAHPSWRKR